MNWFDRARLAWSILRGEAVNGADSVLRCNREHVAGGYKSIKAEELKQFQVAADDLKVARGVIAGVGKTKDYSEMRDVTVKE